MAEESILIPEAPTVAGALAPMPQSIGKRWREIYAKAYAQAQVDSPNEAATHAQTARKAANALLAMPKPETYEEAMALPDWQVIKREEKDGRLGVVTIEGRGAEHGDSKFYFNVPQRSAGTAKKKE